MNPLVWNPVCNVLEEKVRGGDDIILIIVPFAKVDALKRLNWTRATNRKLKLVCRWALDDITCGVSDLEVFTYLREKGCKLYINPTIHLKLYVFASNAAFNTSGNLTLRGLGYCDRPNIEVGNMLQLSSADWANIYQVIATSTQVDEALYLRLKAYVENHPDPVRVKPPFDFVGPTKTYTISSLPATETPDKLGEYCRDPEGSAYSPDEIRRAAHDLVTFGSSLGRNSVDFEMQLGNAFRETPFVHDFVEHLRDHKSLRFGAVNDWIHQKCEDVPLPYGWEIKESTRIFYNWLGHFFSDISWDRPNYSQVIYWQRTQ